MDRMTTISRSATASQLCATGAARFARMANDLSLRGMAADVSEVAGTNVSPSTILRWETCQTRPTGKRGLAYLTVLEGLMAGNRHHAGQRN